MRAASSGSDSASESEEWTSSEDLGCFVDLEADVVAAALLAVKEGSEARVEARRSMRTEGVGFDFFPAAAEAGGGDFLFRWFSGWAAAFAAAGRGF